MKKTASMEKEALTQKKILVYRNVDVSRVDDEWFYVDVTELDDKEIIKKAEEVEKNRFINPDYQDLMDEKYERFFALLEELVYRNVDVSLYGDFSVETDVLSLMTFKDLETDVHLINETIDGKIKNSASVNVLALSLWAEMGFCNGCNLGQLMLEKPYERVLKKKDVAMEEDE